MEWEPVVARARGAGEGTVRHPKDDAGGRTLGFLGRDGVLYCSETCALRAGNREASAVDDEDFDALADAGVRPGPGLCPGCGTDLTPEWPEEAPTR
jgi:hypothetical protein